MMWEKQRRFRTTVGVIGNLVVHQKSDQLLPEDHEKNFKFHKVKKRTQNASGGSSR